MSALPKFTMRELLDAGVHFGHKTFRWNPKMEPYIFGVRNSIHILDLQQTLPLLHQSLQAVCDVVANNGRVLFVGTKRQASKIISENAKRCGQYYVNHRWLGGMLTNWNTVSASIKTLRDLETKLEDKETSYSKKELLKLQRDRNKLERSLGGIRDMGGVPDILFIIDTNKENIAVAEARKLGIPIIAVVDSNSNPEDIDYPIPGNDDAIRAITLYCKLIADSALRGIEQSLAAGGADAGALEKGLQETLPANDDKQIAKKEVKAAMKPKAEGRKKAEKPPEAEAKKEKEEAKETKKPTAKKETKAGDKKAEAKKTDSKKQAVKKPATKKEPSKKKDDDKEADKNSKPEAKAS